MAALDPLVQLELEASLELWDSPDPRELLYVVCLYTDSYYQSEVDH